MSLNRYSIIGNLGQDATVHQLDGSTRCVINFSVAVTEKWKDAQGNPKEATTWVRCALWREAGKTKISEYLKKGTTVLVEGKPSARAYADNQGNPAASLDVQVMDLKLLSSSRNQDGAAASPRPNPTPTFGGAPLNQVPTPNTQPTNWSQTPTAQQDDDLPF